MSRKTIFIVAVVAVLSVSIASAQGQRGAGGGARGVGAGGGRAGQTVEKIQMLKPNLYEITGGGANTLIRVTSQGLIVVDTKNPPNPPAAAESENFSRLMEEIKSVTNQPVKFVINTQHHPDHVGNNQKFIDAGAQVVALEALKTWMGNDARTKDIPGRPTVTFAKDYTLKLGDAEVRLYSFGAGHSGGDTMVYFPDSKVVMVSDQITDATPVVDFANGGSALGWTKILDGVLGLDFEMAIPGRGDPKSKADVQAYRNKFDSLVKRAVDAIKNGATRDQLASQVKTDDLGWTFQASVYGSLYDELTKKPGN